MNELVTVRHYVLKETRCVIVQTVPLVKRCGAVVWMNDNMTWRAKKQAARVIERVK